MEKSILFCWLGMTDLRAASEEMDVGLGPVAQSVLKRQYKEVVLLNNWQPAEAKKYVRWLKQKRDTPISLQQIELSSPTNFGEIYQAASAYITRIKKKHGPDVKLVFHLSPGTPAMAAVWIIIAKTRHPATLIESSRHKGVQVASVPFDISADFIPDLLQGPDERLKNLAAELPPEAPEFSSIVHRCHAMRRVITKARIIAPRSVPVLIEGESGTGKELLARAIHNAGPRKNQRFLAVNCGAIPAELIETELFGHEKGAFTGADRAKVGYFEAAHQGTLFLDEIGELSLPAQVKLLRAIQENEVTRIGATRPVPFDVRIIAATNRNLIEEITQGRYRSDLFYRIAVAVLKLPPVRERQGDLNLLINTLLKTINTESKDEPGYGHKNISANARNIMLKHTWPGNVRELQNTLRRAAIWSNGITIGVDDVRDAILPIAGKQANDLLGHPIGNGFKLSKLIDKLAKYYLSKALSEAGGNKTKAARLIGLPNYQTLTNWLKKHGLE